MNATAPSQAYHVQVPLNIDTVERLMKLPAGQRVLRMYAGNDPMFLFVVIEGGEELPDIRQYGINVSAETCEKPYLRLGEWPMPDPAVQGERRQAKVVYDIPRLSDTLELGFGQRIVQLYVQAEQQVAWIVIEGGEEFNLFDTGDSRRTGVIPMAVTHDRIPQPAGASAGVST